MKFYKLQQEKVNIKNNSNKALEIDDNKTELVQTLIWCTNTNCLYQYQVNITEQ